MLVCSFCLSQPFFSLEFIQKILYPLLYLKLCTYHPGIIIILDYRSSRNPENSMHHTKMVLNYMYVYVLHVASGKIIEIIGVYAFYLQR